MSFYEFLRSAPYLRILAPYTLGIIFSGCIRLPVPVLFFLVMSLVLLSIFIEILKLGSLFHLRWLSGTIINLSLIALGVFSSQKPTTDFTFQGKEIVALGTILEDPHETAKTFSTQIRVNSVLSNGQWIDSPQKILGILQKDSRKSSCFLGKQILLKTCLKPIKNKGNPFEFDYKVYMHQMGFYNSAFVDSSHWKLLQDDPRFNIQLWALKIRDRVLGYFKLLNLSSSAFGVVSALTVGDKSYLDQELINAYVNSGTMHILAVSGMHVALLFWLLQQLTRPLLWFRKGKLIQIMLVLIIIWIFSLVTGLTASVVRAAVMFTFWMLGDTSHRKVNIYNTLSASALLLLLIQPETLYDIGFQLSYMAVLGIVVFYKDIYHLIYTKLYLLQQLWSMVAVSLAAQIFTFPLTLYYFHQFPNYFLLSNIIALPLSTVILYGAIIALVLAPIKMLWFPLGWTIKFLVDLMDNILIWVENLPFAVSHGICISGLMAILLYMMVFCIQLFRLRKYSLFVFTGMIFSIGFSLNLLIFNYEMKQKTGIVVYNIPKLLVIQFIQGENSVVLSDSIGAPVIEKYIRPVRDHLQLTKNHKIQYNSGCTKREGECMLYKGFISSCGKRLFIWDHEPKQMKKGIPMDIDLLVVHTSKKVTFEKIAQYFKTKMVVITGKTSLYWGDQLKKEFDGRHCPCSFVSLDGAWLSGEIKKIDQ